MLRKDVAELDEGGVMRNLEPIKSTTGAEVEDGTYGLSGMILSPILIGIDRCPHCARARPTLEQVWMSGHGGNARGDGGRRSKWGAYACSGCGGMLVAMGKPGEGIGGVSIPGVAATFPRSRVVSGNSPSVARRFLQQAVDTMHAPDAAAVMAGAAVDAMLKAKGYEAGTLYARIDQAKSDALLTAGMAEWAHSVRLGSNRPRHADTERPHVAPEEARRSVDFAEALGNFLFVLTAQIEEATAAAGD